MRYLKLFEEFIFYINESLSGAREMYLKKGLISEEDFNKIKELDPSKNFKYIEKMIEFFINESPSISHIGQVFRDFDNLGKRNQIKNPDISRFKSLKELEEIVQDAQSKYSKKREYKEKSSDVNVVFENEKVLLLSPKTHEAVCKYGANTKWCITEQDPHWYSVYRLEKATHYFIVMKGLEDTDQFYKMAVSVYPDNDIECFDSLDDRMTFEEVLEKSGLDKDLFVFNPLPLTEDEEILYSIRKEIRENDFESNQSLIKDLLKDLKDVNIKDPKSRDGLLVMFLKNHLFDCAKMLIEMGVDVNQKTHKGAYPIEFAYFVKGGEELVDMMKARGAEESDDLKDLEIFAKIIGILKKESGFDIQVIDSLLNKMQNINVKEPKFGDTLLINVLLFENFDENKSNVAKLIIEKGADVKITKNDLATPLHCAALQENSKDIMKMLIDRGADVNAKDDEGNTALSVASGRGNVENVIFLYDNGADIDIKDDEGVSPIIYALYNDQSNVIKFLLEKGAEDINAIYDGETILTEAVKERELEIIKILLSRPDAEVNVQDGDGWTALHWAVENSDTEIVKLLLSHPKNDKSIPNNEGKLPYDLAKTEEMRELLNPNLSESFESYDPYELMITPPNVKAEMIIREIGKDEPNLNLISDLIVLGANLEWKDDYGYTPLIQAARFGEVGIIRTLIDKKVDLDAQNDNGWTALHMIASVHWGKEEAAKMLIAAGARKDIEDKWGRIPYDLAKTEEMRELLNPNLSESFESYDPHELMVMFPNQKTELIIQEIKSDEPNLNLVSDLIVLGANPDGKDEYGSTLLQWTAFHNNKEIAQMLIGAGADVDLQDDNGWTALHVAASENNPEIAKLLLDAGANKDIENEDGRTALDTAIANASFDTIQLLQNLE